MKRDVILGTAIGDIVGSRYEINNCKTGKDFEFFHNQFCKYFYTSFYFTQTAGSGNLRIKIRERGYDTS